MKTNNIIFLSLQQGSDQSILCKKIFVTSILFCITFFGRTQIQQGPVLGTPHSVSEGETVFRVHQYTITSGTFIGYLELLHNDIIPTGNNYQAFQNIRIFTSGVNLMNNVNYDASIDPVPIYLSGANSVTPTLSSPNSSAYTNEDSFFESPVNSGIFSINAGDFLYIVEKINIQSCYNGPTIPLASELDIVFKNTNNTTVATYLNNFSSITLNQSSASTWNSFELPSTVYSAPFSVSQAMIPENCSSPYGNQVARKRRYEFTGSPSTDPVLRIDFTVLNTPTLLEVQNTTDISFKFHFILQNGTVLENVVPVTLADIVLASNNFNEWGHERITEPPLSLTISPSGYPNSPPPLESGFLGPNSRPSNQISYFPSLAACDGNSLAINIVNLHLSNIVAGTINTKDNYYLIGDFIDFIEGSYIEVDYRGTFIPQENFDQCWESLDCQIPMISNGNTLVNGFTICNGQYHQYLSSGTLAEGVQYSQSITSVGPPHIGSGTTDNNSSTWDGEFEEICFELGNIVGLPELSNALLSIDAACSQLELEIELNQGLAIPCPGDIDPNTITYIGGCSSPEFMSNCTTTPPVPLPINAGDIVQIDLGTGQPITATALLVEPLGSCGNGQKWTIRFDLSNFYGSYQPSNTVFSLLNTAQLCIWTQMYCPALDDDLYCKVRSYIIPGTCDISSTYTTPGTYFGQPYLGLSCEGNCQMSTCSEERFMIGCGEVEVTVTCPGCKTPGVIVEGNAAYHSRNVDFVGYSDLNDDGVPETLSTANSADVNLGMLRHGDVMDVDLQTTLYKGEPYLVSVGGAPDDQFTYDELANPTSDCPNLQPLLLSSYVLEISGSSTNLNWVEFSEMFCPLVQANNSLGNAFEFNQDLLNENSLTLYQALAQQYESTIEITHSNFGTVYLTLTEEHIKWLNNETLRIAFDINEVNTLFANAGTPLNLTYFTDALVMNYHIKFITDMDEPMQNWLSGVRSCDMAFGHLAYVTDTPRDVLVGLNGPLPNMQNHLPEYCNASSNQTWWCESGVGGISIAPYIESRKIENVFHTDDIFQNSIERETNIEKVYPTNADDLSPCAEIGPINKYWAGVPDRTNNQTMEWNGNLFPNEVRPPALPEYIDFYLPEPFLPEAIYIHNVGLMNLTEYTGGNGGSLNIRAIIPLEGEFNTFNSGNPYGITITPNQTMPADFLPRFPIMNFPSSNPTTQIVNTSTPEPQPTPQNPGGPIFSVTSNSHPHTRVRVPIKLIYDPTYFGGGPLVNAHGNDVNLLLPPANDSLPIYVGDEQMVLYFALFYTMPQCEGTQPIDPNDSYYHEPYDLSGINAIDHYSKNHQLIYFDGDSRRLLSSLVNPGTQSLIPVDISAGLMNLTPSSYQYESNYSQRLFPDHEIKLTMPNIIRSNPPVMPLLSIPTITTKTDATNNHFLRYSDFSYNTAIQQTLRDQFDGAVPADNTEFSRDLSAPHLYYDQRSDLNVIEYGSSVIFVNPTNGEFSFQFQLTDELIEGLNPIAGPPELFFNGTNTFDQFVTAAGLSSGEEEYHRKYSRLTKRHIDIDKLYFYLKPLALFPGGPILDFNQDIFIETVSGDAPQFDGVSGSINYDLNYSFSNPVPAAKPNGDPQLFKLGSTAMATINNTVENERFGHIFTVTGKFDCSREDVMDWIQNQNLSNNGNIQFPFDLVINYNCNRGFEPLDNMNETAFLANTPYGLNSELQFEYAVANRCSNDAVLDSLRLNITQVAMNVEVLNISPNPCHPVFEVQVSSTDLGSIYLENMQITGVPSNLNNPLITGWNQGALVPNAPNFISLIVDYGNNNCILQPFDFEISLQAQTYCANCAGNPACLLSASGSASFNYSIGSPNSTALDFYNYLPFPSNPCAVILPSGELQININPVIDGIDYNSSTNSYDYQFFFIISDGTTSINFDPIWTAGTPLASFIQNITGVFGPCPDLTITLDQVEMINSCNGNPCNVIHSINQSCNLPAGTGLLLTANIINPVCSGETNGAIDLTVSGGFQPLTISWNDPGNSTSEDLSNLPSGTFTVIVTDALGCIETATYTLNEPTPIVISATVIEGCYEACTGSIDLTVSNGTGIYSYNWTTTGVVPLSNPSDEDQQNLCAATYDVLVTDENLCTTTASFDLNPLPLIVDINPINPLCYGQPGYIQIDVQNGTPNFIYTISGGILTQPIVLTNVGSNQTIGPLEPGNYNVSALDAIGCSFLGNVILIEPPVMQISAIVNPEDCFGNGGSANITVTGGTGSYTYLWSGPCITGNNETNEDQPQLCEGTYNVEVTDLEGCVQNLSIVISGPANLIISATVSDVLCAEESNGSITLTVLGTSGSYSFDWDNDGIGDFDDPQNITNLGPGVYTVIVQNDEGCNTTASYTINEPNPLLLSSNVTSMCENGPYGSIDLNVSGGIGPYNYFWENNDGTFAAIEDLTGLSPGIYTVTVTDGNGCQVSATYVVQLFEVASFDVVAVPETGCQYVIGNLILYSGTPLSTFGANAQVNWTISQGSTIIATGSGFNFTYSFTESGAYNICVNSIVNADGVECSHQLCETFEIECPQCEDPNAQFTYVQSENGSFGFIPELNSQPTGGVTYLYQWNWGDGSAIYTYQVDENSLLFSPQHDYSATGVYEVCLTITAYYPNGTRCSASYCSYVAYCVSQSPSHGCGIISGINFIQSFNGASTTATFTANTDPSWTPTAYYWDFGDGSSITPTTQNTVSHTYTVAGNYWVTLYVVFTNGIQTCTVCKTKKIVILIGQANPGNGNGIIIHPNPGGSHPILSSDYEYKGNVIIRLKSESGNLLSEETRRYEQEIPLDFSVFSRGVYLIEIESDSFSAAGRYVKIE